MQFAGSLAAPAIQNLAGGHSLVRRADGTAADRGDGISLRHSDDSPFRRPAVLKRCTRGPEGIYMRPSDEPGFGGDYVVT